MNDSEWLKRMAEKEDGCIVSVGGLVFQMTDERPEPLTQEDIEDEPYMPLSEFELDLLRGAYFQNGDTLPRLITTIDAQAEEIEWLRERLGLVRMCVNCGRYADVGTVKPGDDLPECRYPEDGSACGGMSACTFDVTPQEAAEHWRKEAHKTQELLSAMCQECGLLQASYDMAEHLRLSAEAERDAARAEVEGLRETIAQLIPYAPLHVFDFCGGPVKTKESEE